MAVRYAGPVSVLADCENVSSPTGTVRVQAFATADFSGDPLAQGFVADKASLIDTLDVTANARLVGLPFGTFFIRAYIDSNGNFKKDDWESWGYAKEAVTIAAGRTAPLSAVWIEDADTDTDWLPDAWEYKKYGNLDRENAYIDQNGRIVLKTATYNSVVAGKANISTFLSGASLTLFENLDAATMLLDYGSNTKKGTVDAIRELVAKNIDPATFKIKALVVDAAAKKVRLTVTADVTDSIAGRMLSPIYELPTTGTVTLKVYRKSDLASEGWGNPVKTVTTTYTPTALEDVIEVGVSGIDFSSGFYKVEIE